MRICIKNLRLRTFIGFKESERTEKQDVVINLAYDYDAERAARGDDPSAIVNYKKVKKKIVELVESGTFLLLEALAERIAEAVLEDARIVRVETEVDKPGALRFADSVSASCIVERAL